MTVEKMAHTIEKIEYDVERTRRECHAWGASARTLNTHQYKLAQMMVFVLENELREAISHQDNDDR